MLPGASSFFTNPLRSIYHTVQVKTVNAISNNNLEYKLLPNLSLRSNIGYNKIATTELSLNPTLAKRPETGASISSRSAVYGNRGIKQRCPHSSHK